MIDAHAATELKLYIDNDGDLYRSMTTSILKNLATKKARGEYDSYKATKAFVYLVEAGAKKYAKEFGGTWHQMFNVPTRVQVAHEMVDDFETAWNEGAYTSILPKKYQPKEKASSSRHHTSVKKGKSQAQIRREVDEILATKDPAALRRSITKRGHLLPKVVATRYDDTGKAIDTVHTLKMNDGRVITTTWHDTRAQANARIKGTRGRDPSKDRVLPGGVLGNFRVITWSY